MKYLLSLFILCTSTFLNAQESTVEVHFNLSNNPNHKGFYVHNNTLPEILLNAAKKGSLPFYFPNDSIMNLKELENRLLIEDEYFGFGFGFDAYEAHNYHFPQDLYEIILTDEIDTPTKKINRKWLTLCLPADAPNNFQGVQFPVVKFNFKEALTILNESNHHWHHPINAADSILIGNALTLENTRLTPHRIDVFIGSEKERFNSMKALKNSAFGWYADFFPKLDAQGYFITNRPYYNRYYLTFSAEDDEKNSFKIRANDVPELLVEAFKKGRLSGYRINYDGSKKEMTLKEFMQSMEMYDEAAYSEIYYYDEYGNEQEIDTIEYEPIYYDAKDLSIEFTYSYEVFDFAGQTYALSPQYITLFISAMHPENMTGIQRAIISFDYIEIQNILAQHQILWQSPIDLKHSLTATEAINKKTFPSYAISGKDLFGEYVLSLGYKNGHWFDWQTETTYTSTLLDSCAHRENYTYGVSNFKNLLIDEQQKMKAKKVDVTYYLSEVLKPGNTIDLILENLKTNNIQGYNFETLQKVDFPNDFINFFDDKVYLEERVLILDDAKKSTPLNICLSTTYKVVADGHAMDHQEFLAFPIENLTTIPELKKMITKLKKGKIKTSPFKTFETMDYGELVEKNQQED